MGDKTLEQLKSEIESLKKRIRRCQPPRGAGSSERASVECERNRLKFELADLVALLQSREATHG